MEVNDYKAAFAALGYDVNVDVDKYTWHHLDDFDIETGEATMQLVSTRCHVTTVSHSGSCAQYKYITGYGY